MLKVKRPVYTTAPLMMIQPHVCVCRRHQNTLLVTYVTIQRHKGLLFYFLLIEA